MNQLTKICTKCDLAKATACFYKHVKSADGLRTYCSDCSRSYNKQNKDWLYQKEKINKFEKKDHYKKVRKLRNVKNGIVPHLTLEELKQKYIGTKVNKLLVTDVVNHPKFRGYFFKYKCDCGNEGIARRYNFISENPPISCGCAHKEAYIKRILPHNKAAYNALISRYKRGAQKRDLEFSITDDQFFSFITQNCHYCDLAPSVKVKSKSSSIVYTGIDRKDNNLGYTIENCVPCCSQCNRIKHALGYDEFLNHIKTILQNLGKI